MVRGAVRAYSQPPPQVSRPPPLPGSRASSPDSVGDAPDHGCDSPGAASNQSDPLSAGRPAPRSQPQPWKQKEIQVKGADYYLNLLKQARGQAGKAPPAGAMPTRSKASQGGSCGNLVRRNSGGADEDWDSDMRHCDDGRSGYAHQMRARASVVEAAQRQEETARHEKGYAVLQKVQMRAMKAPSRTSSTDSARAKGAADLFSEAQLVSA